MTEKKRESLYVTILILIDGFLQLLTLRIMMMVLVCHNPYFNRWFSAISFFKGGDKIEQCHNPYFNRWFSAILVVRLDLLCH